MSEAILVICILRSPNLVVQYKNKYQDDPFFSIDYFDYRFRLWHSHIRHGIKFTSYSIRGTVSK